MITETASDELQSTLSRSPRLRQREAGVEFGELVEQAQRPLVIGRAVHGHGHAPRGPVQQLGAQMRLQLLDQLGDGRLRHVQEIGGAREAPGLDDPHESPHRGKLVHKSSYYFRM